MSGTILVGNDYFKKKQYIENNIPNNIEDVNIFQLPLLSHSKNVDGKNMSIMVNEPKIKKSQINLIVQFLLSSNNKLIFNISSLKSIPKSIQEHCEIINFISEDDEKTINEKINLFLTQKDVNLSSIPLIFLTKNLYQISVNSRSSKGRKCIENVDLLTHKTSSEYLISYLKFSFPNLKPSFVKMTKSEGHDKINIINKIQKKYNISKKESNRLLYLMKNWTKFNGRFNMSKSFNLSKSDCFYLSIPFEQETKMKIKQELPKVKIKSLLDFE